MLDRLKSKVAYNKRIYEVFLYCDEYVKLRDTDEDGDYIKIPRKACTLLASTGIRDSNGKLIFEGDITQRNGDNFEVVYNEKARWYFRYISDNLYGHLQDDEIKEHKNHKIIGNIYENPELLNNS